MKKIIFGMLAAVFIIAASVNTCRAQVSVSLNLWSPPAEYSGVNYYYLPDVDAYYYVPTHRYVYLEDNQWVFRSSLPPRYSGYNISNGYKVAVYRPRPYRYYNTDRVTYARYRGMHDRQVIVRDHYYKPRTVYKTRYVNRPAKVVNHTRYVNRPTKTVYKTRYVNNPTHYKPHTVTRTKTRYKPNNVRVTTRTRIAARPGHPHVVSRTKVVSRPSHGGGHGAGAPGRPHGGGGNKH